MLSLTAKTLRTCQLPKSTLEVPSTKKSHTQERTLSFPCADRSLSHTSISLDLTVAKGPLRETTSKMRKKKWKAHPSKKKVEIMFGTRVVASCSGTMKYIDQKFTCQKWNITCSVKIRRRDEAGANKNENTLAEECTIPDLEDQALPRIQKANWSTHTGTTFHTT